MLKHPDEVGIISLELIRLRSRYRVAQALLARCPTEPEVEEFFSSTEVQQCLDKFVTLILELRAEIAAGTAEPDNVWRLTEEVYPEALLAINRVCELLNIAPQDLMSVLLTDVAQEDL